MIWLQNLMALKIKNIFFSLKMWVLEPPKKQMFGNILLKVIKSTTIV